MNDIRNIVWANDGSAESKRGLEYAKLLAKTFGAKINALYVSVMPETALFPHSKALTDELYTWMLQAEQKYASEMQKIGEGLEKEGIPFGYEILKGKPSEQIVEYAGKTQSELIIMGNKGLGLIGKLILGSTTLNTLKLSEIPVLGVHDHEWSGEIKRILVPVDAAEDVNGSIEYSLRLATHFDADVEVLYVFKLDAYAFEIPVNIIDSMLDLSKKELKGRVDKVVKQMESDGYQKINITQTISQGLNPIISIMDHADRQNADLIVMHTHGRKGLAKFILGSVTEVVMQQSETPVLVIKP